MLNSVSIAVFFETWGIILYLDFMVNSTFTTGNVPSKISTNYSLQFILWRDSLLSFGRI